MRSPGNVSTKFIIARFERSRSARITFWKINAPWLAPQHPEQLLLENAPWKEVDVRIASTLATTPSGGTVQLKTDRLISAVSQALHALTPRAKPSPHAKRWWTADLTQLCQIYSTHIGETTPDQSDEQGERCHAWRTWPQVRENNTETKEEALERVFGGQR
jgi:hypothetical protein